MVIYFLKTATCYTHQSLCLDNASTIKIRFSRKAKSKQTSSEHVNLQWNILPPQKSLRDASNGDRPRSKELVCPLTVYPSVGFGIHRHTSLLSTCNIPDNKKFLHSTNNSFSITHSLPRYFQASTPTSHSLANICATVHNLSSHKSYNLQKRTLKGTSPTHLSNQNNVLAPLPT